MSDPTNTKLYNYVKSLASKKFTSPSGIYRSSWIVREYKKRGGKYTGSSSKSIGLKRWFKEDWVDLNRPKYNSKGKIIGYHKCGRKSSKIKGVYPLCRPSKHITSKSPKTYKQLSKKSIEKAKKLKKIYTYKKNINFNKMSIKNSVKRPTKRSVKRSIKRSVKRSIKRSVKRPVKLSVKRSIKRSVKRPIKRSVKRPIKRSVKSSVKRPIKRSVKSSVKSSV